MQGGTISVTDVTGMCNPSSGEVCFAGIASAVRDAQPARLL